MHVYVCVCAHACVICVHMYVCVHMCVYVCVYVCVCVGGGGITVFMHVNVCVSCILCTLEQVKYLGD